MDKVLKIQNILIVITAVIITIFLVQTSFNIVNSKGISLSQVAAGGVAACGHTVLEHANKVVVSS